MKVVKDGQKKFAFNPMPHKFDEIDMIRNKFGVDIVNDYVFNIQAEDIEKIEVVYSRGKYRVGAIMKECSCVVYIKLDEVVSKEELK